MGKAYWIASYRSGTPRAGAPWSVPSPRLGRRSAQGFAGWPYSVVHTLTVFIAFSASTRVL